MSEQRGLYPKYRILKRDTGEEIEGPSFVLRPDRDRAAMEALYRYAERTTNIALANDMFKWLDAIEIREDRSTS